MTAQRGGATPTKPSLLQRVREKAPAVRVLAIAALAIGLIATLAVSGLPGGGGDDEPAAAPARIADTRSSWIPGQASLVTSSEYMAVVERAEEIASGRADARAKLIKRLAAKKKADLKRERDKARERYLALRRAALARYRAALRQNAKDKAAAAERRRRALAEYRERIRKYRESLIIKPGEECRLPSVRQRYDCSSGLLPHEPLPGLE